MFLFTVSSVEHRRPLIIVLLDQKSVNSTLHRIRVTSYCVPQIDHPAALCRVTSYCLSVCVCDDDDDNCGAVLLFMVKFWKIMASTLCSNRV